MGENWLEGCADMAQHAFVAGQALSAAAPASPSLRHCMRTHHLLLGLTCQVIPAPLAIMDDSPAPCLLCSAGAMWRRRGGVP